MLLWLPSGPLAHHDYYTMEVVSLGALAERHNLVHGSGSQLVELVPCFALVLF